MWMKQFPACPELVRGSLWPNHSIVHSLSYQYLYFCLIVLTVKEENNYSRKMVAGNSWPSRSRLLPKQEVFTGEKIRRASIPAKITYCELQQSDTMLVLCKICWGKVINESRKKMKKLYYRLENSKIQNTILQSQKKQENEITKLCIHEHVFSDAPMLSQCIMKGNVMNHSYTMS